MRKISLTMAVLLVATINGRGGNADIIDVTVGPDGSFVFSPENTTINLGDTVRWTWDSDGHNVGSGVPGAPSPFFLSGPPELAGTIFEVVFDAEFLQANTVPTNLYDYHCHPHGDFGMIGSVKVTTLLGDVNLDNSTNLLDVQPFVNLFA